MNRSSSYESAFEAYLQGQRLCYVAVHEGRRAFLGETKVKNLDFIVHGQGGLGLLVDIKGRRFPGGSADKPRRIWECWSTQEDIDGLGRWAELFGEDYHGLLVFAYHLTADETPADDLGDLFTWRNQRYLFRGVAVDEYRRHLRVRSPRWGTVHVASKVFRELARPFHYFTQEFQPVAAECPF
ncbi:MAG TPA: HYExAFE family protein [Gemmataceae bacterium]|nr:HYExAFE family protein [Gemmataceae bacterium]